jgi:hypothetical protein
MISGGRRRRDVPNRRSSEEFSACLITQPRADRVELADDNWVAVARVKLPITSPRR